MQFLKSAEALKTIARFLEAEEEDIAIAVAFWGGNAKKLLQIGNWKASKVRIICDAASGACNPQALQYLRTRFPGNLFTNPRLHSKVYWTPKKVVITSANASASGLSLEDSETDGNIEAGVLSTDPEILKGVKKWFDDTVDLPGTVEVDDQIMKVVIRMWKRRRIGRRVPDNIPTLMAALQNGANLKDLNIFVVNYKDEGRSEEGQLQHSMLQKKWASNEEKPPVSVGENVVFSSIDDYEEFPECLKSYPWQSWIIDLNDPRFFWYVPERARAIPNAKSKTVTIPLYGAKRLPLGIGSVPLSGKDVSDLKRRWRKKIGKKSDDWVLLTELAD